MWDQGPSCGEVDSSSCFGESFFLFRIRDFILNKGDNYKDPNTCLVKVFIK